MRYPLLLAAGTILGLLAALPAQGQRRQAGDVWQFLAAKYDQNKDGRIEPGEYDRERAKFEAYDQDGDGSLTAADFRGGLRRQRGAGQRRQRVDIPAELGRLVAQGADLDEDGVVTRKEWSTVAPRVDADGDKRISAAELKDLFCAATGRAGLSLRAVERRAGRVLDADRSGAVEVSELLALFAKVDTDRDGKLSAAECARQARFAPRVGTLAPDFDLPLVDDPKKSIRLSSFRGEKPVALIFGSYT